MDIFVDSKPRNALLERLRYSRLPILVNNESGMGPVKKLSDKSRYDKEMLPVVDGTGLVKLLLLMSKRVRFEKEVNLKLESVPMRFLLGRFIS